MAASAVSARGWSRRWRVVWSEARLLHSRSATKEPLRGYVGEFDLSIICLVNDALAPNFSGSAIPSPFAEPPLESGADE